MSGYVMVPREPTPEMIAAAETAAWDHDNHMPAIGAMSRAWPAFLSAAPPAPTVDAGAITVLPGANSHVFDDRLMSGDECVAFSNPPWSQRIAAALSPQAPAEPASRDKPRWGWGYPDGVPGTPEYEPAPRVCNWCKTVASRCRCDATADEPAIPAGMVRWHGSDGPPDDWDGGLVYLRDGKVYSPKRDEKLDWRRITALPCSSDIIAYTPKPAPPADDGYARGIEDEAKVAENRAPVVKRMSFEPIVTACHQIATAIRALTQSQGGRRG